jgi:hypothetical protein
MAAAEAAAEQEAEAAATTGAAAAVGEAKLSNPDAAAAAAAVAVDAMDVDVEENSMARLRIAEPEQQQQSAEFPGTCIVCVAVRVLGRGRCDQGALIVLPAEQSVSAAGSSSVSSSSSLVRLLGYVTVTIPRGAPAACYQGGVGFCSVKGLWQLRCRDATPGSSRVLRAWAVNPGSDKLRRVELTLLLK